MKVSVIIPSYNHEKYVGEAIQSVLDQTYSDFEIVITDDGSNDNTVSEIKKFTDPRIRLFTFDQNQGADFALTNCIKEAKGEYFAILSSDDMFLPHKLEKQIKFLDTRPEIWAVFGYAQIIDEEGNNFTDKTHFYYSIFKQFNRTRFEWLNHFFNKGNCLCHSSVLARRDVYTTICPPDPRYTQLGDYYMWIKVCLEHEIYIIQENLIKFRVRQGEKNASGNRPETVIRDSFETIQILKVYLNIKNVEDFMKIFPKAIKEGEKAEKTKKEMIPFLIAMLALKKDSPLYRYLAIDTLYEIFRNKNIAKKIEKNYGFNYIDFIKLTGKYDLFNVLKKGKWLVKNRRRNALFNFFFSFHKQ